MRENVILDWSLTNFVTVTLMWIMGLILLALVLRLIPMGGGMRRRGKGQMANDTSDMSGEDDSEDMAA